jgi:hypothetical protein
MESDLSSQDPSSVRRDVISTTGAIQSLLVQAMRWLITEQTDTGLTDDEDNDRADDGSDGEAARWNPIHHLLHREIHELSEAIVGLKGRLEEDAEKHDVLSEDPGTQRRSRGRITVPPILTRTLEVAESLLDRFCLHNDDVFRELLIDAIWRKQQFHAALANVKTGDATLAYLDFIQLSDPPEDFWQTLGRPVASVATLRSLRGLRYPTDNWRAQCARASILTTALFDRPPSGFYKEKMAYKLLSHVEPQLTQAITGWIREADRIIWGADIRPHLIPLLRAPYVANFTHLVLTEAMKRWPASFRWDSPDPGPRDALTKALLRRDIRPIHFAAALGLKHMMNDILYCGFDDPNQRSQTVGSPLFCALFGEDIILWRTTRRNSEGRNTHTYYTPDRAAVIARLLQVDANVKPSASWQTTDYTSMCSMAFFAAWDTHNVAVWTTFLEKGPRIDTALRHLLYTTKPQEGGFEKRKAETLAKLLTALLDHSLLRPSGYEEFDAEIQSAIGVCLDNNNLELVPYGENGEEIVLRLAHLSHRDYMTLLHGSLLNGMVLAFERLMLEPRFKAALQVPDHQDTLLHLAASGDHFKIVELLLEAGANVDVHDSEGRTPLMCSESTEMASLLVEKYGASTGAIDHEGRNVWHLAGGSNDAELMKWLCLNDPIALENMKVVSYDGNTPLAEAVLFIDRLAEQVPDAVNLSLRHPAAAMAFFHHCPGVIDEDCLTCKIPITHVAAEWGYLGLISRIAQAGADFTQLNSQRQSALYRIPMSASHTVVARLLKLCGESSPVVDSHSRTPAEVIFRHTKLLMEEDDGGVDPRLAGMQISAHPFCVKPLSPQTYELLLTPETLAWHDGNGNGLWERFCREVVMQFPIPPDEAVYKPVAFMYESVKTALQCLVESNVIVEFERRTGRCALSCFDPREMKLCYQTTQRELSQFPQPSGPMGSLSPMFHLRQEEKRWWNVRYLEPYIMILLRAMQGPVAEAFYASEEAKMLYTECLEECSTRIVEWLTERMVGYSAFVAVEAGDLDL